MVSVGTDVQVTVMFEYVLVSDVNIGALGEAESEQNSNKCLCIIIQMPTKICISVIACY